MEFIFELIFEIIFEGTLELSTNQKVPFILRLLAGLLIGAIYAGIIILFFTIAMEVIKDGNTAGGVVIIVIDVFFAVMCAWGFIRKYRQRRH